VNPSSHPPVARVLLVDDEPVVLTSLRETLRPEGFTIALANSPSEALELARQHTFAVVVSDYQMPEMNGVELLAEIRKLRPDAGRILISAVPTAECMIEAVNEAQICRFIVKPWRREELVRAVREAIARYQRLAHDQLVLTTTTAMNDTLHKLTESLQHQLEEERTRKGLP
jgi:response regulator RpfG family c-di-GMP phosphodiesterase